MFFLCALLFAAAYANDDCGGPMVVRKILPLHGAENVPINAQIFVALAGNGNADHMRISARENIGGLDVEFELDTACYAHESDTEFHCNYELKPLSNLKELTEYQISLNGTELHAEGDFGYSTTFTTGFTTVELDREEPELEILEYVMRPPDAVGDCDWPDAMKYEIRVSMKNPDPNWISLIHTYEVDPIDCTEELVHTVFPIANIDSFDFHQVLEPGTEGERCYRAEHEDLAGNATDSSQTICWDMAAGAGFVFDGCSFSDEDPQDSAEDSAQDPDIDEDATEEPQDNESENDNSTSEAEGRPNAGVEVKVEGGCAGVLCLPFLLLVFRSQTAGS